MSRLQQNISFFDPSWQDPYGTEIDSAELSVIIVFGIFSLVNLFISFHLLWNRSYLPFRIKSVPLVLTSFLGSFCLSLGTLVVLRVIPQASSPFLLLCSIWFFWIFQVLGASLVCTCLAFRFFLLYFIVKLQRTATNTILASIFIGFWGPAIVVFLLLTVLSADGPFYHTLLQTKVCSATLIAQSCIMIVIAFYFICFLFFGFSLRGIQKEYQQEYSETRNAAILLILSALVSYILSLLELQYYSWGRVLGAFFMVIGANIVPLLIVAVPLYYSLFDREGYEGRIVHLIGMTPKPASERTESGQSTASLDSQIRN